MKIMNERDSLHGVSAAETAIQELLRLGDEEWVYINELQAHGILMDSSTAFMAQLSDFYDTWPHHDEIQLPTKQVFENPALAGDFRVMPCVIKPMKLKLVKIIGTNEEQRTIKDKICVGKAMLIDHYDNHVYAVFDVCALSSFRTAAIACLALQRSGLSPQAVGLVGCGRIGFYTAHILHRRYGLEFLSVCDPDPVNYGRFTELCSHYVPGLRIQYKTQDNLCRDSDALFLATTSENSLCDSSNSRHISFISSVGADANNLSEIDMSLIKTHRLVTDSLQSIALGDMHRWHSAGKIYLEMVTELKDFTTATHPQDKKILFISTGVAVQDALVCKFIYDKLFGGKGGRSGKQGS